MEILQSRIHKSRISSLQPELVLPKIRTSSCVNCIDFQTCVDYFSVLYHKKSKKTLKTIPADIPVLLVIQRQTKVVLVVWLANHRDFAA